MRISCAVYPVVYEVKYATRTRGAPAPAALTLPIARLRSKLLSSVTLGVARIWLQGVLGRNLARLMGMPTTKA